MSLRVFKSGNFVVLFRDKVQNISQIHSDFERVIGNNIDGTTKQGFYRVFDNRNDLGEQAHFSQFVDENNTPIGNEDVVVDFLRGITGSQSYEGDSSTATPVYVTQQPVMRTDVSVPAGFRSVTIMRLGGNITVDIGDGTNRLGGGSNPRAITIDGDVFGNSYGILPEITITGGSWQWVATPQI